MNGHGMSIRKHLGGMLTAAAVVLGALVLFGVPLDTALRYALLLSCPLMMVGMMLMMGRHNGHGATAATVAEEVSQPSRTVAAQRDVQH